MKRILVLLCLGMQTLAQPPQPAAKPIDWSKLNPQMVEMALDGIDATERVADVLEKGDAVYAPRADEAEKIFQKMKRSAESPADWSVYSSAALYHFQVNLCRIQWVEANCNIDALRKLHDQSMRDVKDAKARLSSR